MVYSRGEHEGQLTKNRIVYGQHSFFNSRIQMLQIIKHFITEDFGVLFMDKSSEIYKTSKHYYINISNLFSNVQDYAGK